MTAPTIHVVPRDGQDRSIAPLVVAFSEDPVPRWLYPEAARLPGPLPAAGPRLATIQVDDGPPVWPMLRRPR